MLWKEEILVIFSGRTVTDFSAEAAVWVLEPLDPTRANVLERGDLTSDKEKNHGSHVSQSETTLFISNGVV